MAQGGIGNASRASQSRQNVFIFPLPPRAAFRPEGGHIMKRFVFVLIVGLLLFGCTSGPQVAPSATPLASANAVASPSPSPTTAVQAAGADVVQLAAQSVPSSGFSELVGVTPSAPDAYVMTTEGQVSLSASLGPINEWKFESASFTDELRKIATAGYFTKTVSYSGDQISVRWVALVNNGNGYEDGDAIEAEMSRTDRSSLCVIPQGKTADCLTPTKGQVEQLWKALESNALEESLQTLVPGLNLKDFLKVSKGALTKSGIGRDCTAYSVALTDAGIEAANAMGGRSFADLNGTFCIDTQYGFPLDVNLKSTLASANEKVVRFSTARVGVLQYPFSYNGLCTYPGRPCNNNHYSNPDIYYAPYPDATNAVLEGSTDKCQAVPGRMAMKAGDCVRFDSGDVFVLQEVGASAFSLIKYDHNHKAKGEYHITPVGDVQKDQYDLGVNIDGQVMALDVAGLTGSTADLDFIAFDQYSNAEVKPTYSRSYYSGFADTLHPTAKEAYYAIFSTHTQDEEGVQRYSSGDSINLKHGAMVAFYWFYPEPYSSVSKAGRLDDHVTAYVWPYGTDPANGTAYRLEVGKPLELGPVSKKYLSTIRLELISADLTRDGSVKIDSSSSALKESKEFMVSTDAYYDTYTVHRLCPFGVYGTGVAADEYYTGDWQFSIPSDDFKVTAITPSMTESFHAYRPSINGVPLVGPMGCDMKVNNPLAAKVPYKLAPGPYSGPAYFDATKLFKKGRNDVKMDVINCFQGSNYGGPAGSCTDFYVFYHKPANQNVPDDFRYENQTYKCQNLIRFDFYNTLPQNTNCNPLFPSDGHSTYTLPAGATNARLTMSGYSVNDGCESVVINGKTVVSGACPVCPAIVRNPVNAVLPLPDNQIDMKVHWVDSQGGKGEKGGLAIGGTLQYDAPKCVPDPLIIVDR